MRIFGIREGKSIHFIFHSMNSLTGTHDNIHSQVLNIFMGTDDMLHGN